MDGPAVLFIACVSNKVNHDFNMKMLSHDINMSRFTLPSLTKQQTVGILVLDDVF